MESSYNEKKRTIESVLDLRSGNEVFANEFFDQDDGDKFRERYNNETAISNGTSNYICFYCKQPVKIRGGIGEKRILHFAHLRDSDECPIKTGNQYTRDQIQRIKYNGAKESEPHYNLKNLLAEFLIFNKNSKNGIENVEIEKVFKDRAIPSDWKRPDVTTIYYGRNLVFELQLSTTFLSIINSRQEFYKKNETYILWVFNHFDTNEETRKFTQSDIFYNNNHNGFEFGEEEIKESKKVKDLILKCHYQKPTLSAEGIKTSQECKFVKLNELVFNKYCFEVYYFDYRTELKIYNDMLSLCLIQEILKGDMRSICNMILRGYEITKKDKKALSHLYKHEIQPYFNIGREWKSNIVWAIILSKFDRIQDISKLHNDSNLKHIILVILNLKLDKIIGYKYKTHLEIAHTVFQSRKEYIGIYLKALEFYNRTQMLIRQDESGKLFEKIRRYNFENIKQNNRNDDILKKIFPELFTER